MSVVILSLSRPILFFCVSVKWNFFFFFQDIDPDDENMQLFLSMGVEINGVVKKVSFITLSKGKVILLIKSLTVCEYFFLDIKMLWVFLPKKICLTIDKVRCTKRDPIFPHSLFIVLLVLPLYLRRCTELLCIYYFHLFFFMLFVCLVCFFLGFFFLLIFLVFLSFLFFVLFCFSGFCFVKHFPQKIFCSQYFTETIYSWCKWGGLNLISFERINIYQDYLIKT